MSSYKLPPVRHLPHWSRVGFIARPLPLSHQPPLQLVDREVVGGGGENTSRIGMDMLDTRVASLQRNITFLQQQHKDTLEKLHAEVDELRRENKELQYKLIMDPAKLSRKTLTHGQRSIRPPTQGSDAGRGIYAEHPLLDTRASQEPTLGTADACEILGLPPADHSKELRGSLITSLQPLRIHSSAVHPPRAPTLHECEVLIRQLYNANSMQSQEILRVKAVLRDIVFHKKITPENYILTKAFLADHPSNASGTERFPQLPHKQLPKKGPRSSLERVPDGVILPALKLSLGSTMAERQKRTQAAQRNRLKRAVR